MCLELCNQSYIVMAKAKWPRLYYLVIFLTPRPRNKIEHSTMFDEWCMRKMYHLVYVPSLTNALPQLMNYKNTLKNRNHSCCNRLVNSMRFMHMCPIVNVSPNSNSSKSIMKKRKSCRQTTMSLHDSHPVPITVVQTI